MGDKRFMDRIKRIEKRTRRGAPVELIAGVGAVKHAKAKARRSADTPHLSPFLILFGGVAGVFAFGFLRDRIGMDVIAGTPVDAVPVVLQEVVLVDNLIAATAGFVALSALLTLFSFFRGRPAAKMMSFFGAAFGAIAGAAYVSL